MGFRNMQEKLENGYSSYYACTVTIIGPLRTRSDSILSGLFKMRGRNDTALSRYTG